MKDLEEKIKTLKIGIIKFVENHDFENKTSSVRTGVIYKHKKYNIEYAMKYQSDIYHYKCSNNDEEIIFYKSMLDINFDSKHYEYLIEANSFLRKSLRDCKINNILNI